MYIKKTYNGVVPSGKVLNNKSENQNDTYSCDYINKLIEKTDWIDISTTNFEVFYRTYGDLVEISYKNIGSSTLTGYTWTVMATLPTNIRPKKVIYDIPYQRRLNSVRLELLSNGNLTLFNWDAQASLTEAGLICGHITYIKD